MSSPSPSRTAQRGIHYAWWILVACVLMFGAALGIVGTTAGVFLTPVADEYGWSRTDVSLYLTIMPLVAAVIQPVLGRLLNTIDVRILLGGGMVLLGGGVMLSSTFTAIWQWNAFGVLYGIALGIFMYLPIPVILGNWFAKSNGLALGIAVASSSVLGAIFSPVANALIESIGWRQARLWLGVIALVVGLPLTVLVLRLKPADKGLLPYGATGEDAGAATTAAKAPSMTTSAALRTAAFWMILVMAGGIVFSASMYQQIPSYATGIDGLGASTGALAVSVVMIGGIVGKIAFGWLNDRFGIRFVVVLALGSGIVGSFLTLLAGGNVALFYVGAVLFGLGYASLAVVSPLITRTVFGDDNFSAIYSGITTGITLFSAAAPLIFAQVYDRTQSFTIAWVLVGGAFVLALVLALLALALGTRRRQTA